MKPVITLRKKEDSRSSQWETLSRSERQLRKEYKEQEAWGLLASIDLHHCNANSINDAEKIKQFVYELCDRIEMKRFGECQVVWFGSGDLAGYSMVQLIETSLLSAHFDSMIANHAYIDIFSCKYYNPYEAAEFAKKFFGAENYNMTYTLRK
jgi:S-adenosylmethionine/arginine decarboxylase-like enzyme